MQLNSFTGEGAREIAKRKSQKCTARRDWSEEKNEKRLGGGGKERVPSFLTPLPQAPPLVRSSFQLFSSAILHALSTIQKRTASGPALGFFRLVVAHIS